MDTSNTQQHPSAAEYWRDTLDLPPDTIIYDEQALRQKFNPRCHILAESAYGTSDIRECLCGKVVLHYADGRTVNWSDGRAHTCQQPEQATKPVRQDNRIKRIADHPPVPGPRPDAKPKSKTRVVKTAFQNE